MTNALTSVSHSRLAQSRAIERFRSDRTASAKTVTADAPSHVDPAQAAHPTARRPHPVYVAGFVVQAIANDNGPHAEPHAAARAYWDMNYRLADLPIGFLISKAV